MSLSPVEQALQRMAQQWADATAAMPKGAPQLLVWRTPENGQRMVAAFFEAQRQAVSWQLPDLFVPLSQGFETGFLYARALREGLIGQYQLSKEQYEKQALAHDWAFAKLPAHDTPAGVAAVASDFATHHGEQWRRTVLALLPEMVSTPPALQRWLEGLLAAPLAPGVCVCLADTVERPVWDGLIRKLGTPHAVLLQADVDLFRLAQQTAAQSPGGDGPAASYRQLVTDVLALVQKGTPAQVSARADKALAVATAQNWPDQQVMLHMAVAGAHTKAQELPSAIARYQQARTAAEAAVAAQNPAGPNLLMQTWFGEAGVWLVSKQPRRAAECYAQAATVAQGIPNTLFALEALRMKAYCEAQAGDTDAARRSGALAIREGQNLPAAERPQSTLGLALHDQLKVQDAPRAAQLEALSERYQADCEAARADGERRAAALGAKPAPGAVDGLIAALNEAYEQHFVRLLTDREALITSGDVYFRKVVATGRELLHPRWNGSPEVRHPLDAPAAQWKTPPQGAGLVAEPAAGGPLADGGAASGTPDSAATSVTATGGEAVNAAAAAGTLSALPASRLLSAGAAPPGKPTAAAAEGTAA